MGFDISLDLDLDDLGGRLSDLVSQEPFAIQGRRIGIRRLDLAGDGRALLLTATLAGDASGEIRIRAEPVFDRQSQAIALAGLEFVYEPDDPEQALMVNLFYQRIQQALQEAANALLERGVGQLRGKLAAALKRALPQDLALDLSRLRLEDLNLALSPSAVRLSGRATGGVVVSVR
jgi:hypothetical protein